MAETKLPHYRGILTGSMLHDAMEAGDGFATFDCESEEAFLAAAQEYGVVFPHRDADERGITYLRERPGLGPERGVGFTKGPLLPHTDRPAAKVPPRVLLLWCRSSSVDGGEATVLRGTDVAASLGERNPDALKAYCEDDAAIFRTGGEEMVSPIFRMVDGAVAEVRLRFDPYVYFAPNAARALPALERAFEETEIAFSLAPGKGYAIRNDLWFHGRRAYSGNREMLRIMIGSSHASSRNAGPGTR
ncbi:TauD/TfdA family dioxygenase [Streptomyces parvus]|nr:TauD/TfdA family dioxygenase [Streptomyces sp. CB02613]